MRISLATAVVLLWSLAWPSLAAGPGGWGVAASIPICRAENHPTHAIASLTVQRLYSRLGYSVKFLDYPSKRSLYNLQKGKCIAEVGRIEGSAALPHVLVLPTPIHYARVRAYYLDPLLMVRGWESLEGLTIGAVRGEFYAAHYLPGEDISYVNNYQGLVNFLRVGRVDVIVGLDESVEPYLSNEIYASGEPLLAEPIYHLIHEDYAEIIPALDAQRKRMIIEDSSQ